MRDDLYEQCSDHITANMPSSVKLGVRPSRDSIFLYSSSVRPCASIIAAVICSVISISYEEIGVWENLIFCFKPGKKTIYFGWEGENHKGTKKRKNFLFFFVPLWFF